MQAEVMSLRGSQWLQLFHEQAQSGQTVAQWCREHHVASSIYYRRKNALREELLEEMETEQRRPNLPATVTDSQSEPQFAALAMPEVVREKASARRSTLVQSTPAIRIKIGETEIEVPEGIESKHLEMVLKAVQNAR